MCLIRVISTLCRAVVLQVLSLTPLVDPIFSSLSLLNVTKYFLLWVNFKWATFYFYLSIFLDWYFYLYLSTISVM